MNGCTEKRLSARRHHYELGLLSAAERREFELHLLECEACFEAVQKFQNTARQIRHNPKVREIINREAERQPADTTAQVPTRGWRRVIPAMAVVAIALLVFILKPWHIEFQPDLEAVAAENRLAILPFNNLADPSDSLNLGRIIADLLITDLSGSQYMQVISSRRLDDVNSLLERKEETLLPGDLAGKIAAAVKAHWIFTGSIIEDSPAPVLTGQLAQTESGVIVQSFQITGQPGESIFTIIDRLSTEVKNSLSLPPGAGEEKDLRVADVTTYSADAYRYYIEGMDYFSKHYNREAAASFKQALEHDSTFAMVYYHLALVENAKYIKRAVKYASKTGEKEQLYIASLNAQADGEYVEAVGHLQKLVQRYPDEKEAFYRLGWSKYARGKYLEAIDYLNQAIAIDSLYKEAYNLQAYTYHAADDYENSILAINTYIKLYPNEANPYDTRGQLYAAGGEIEKAIASYKKALEIKPDFHSSAVFLGYLYMQKREYGIAEEYFQRLVQSPYQGTQAEGRYYLAFLPMHMGKFQASLDAFDSIIVLERQLEYNELNIAYKHRAKAFVLQTMGRSVRAIEEMEKCLSIREQHSRNKIVFRDLYILLLAENGFIDKAKEEAEKLRVKITEEDARSMAYWFAQGAIAEAEGDFNTALDNYTLAADSTNEFPYQFMQARVALKLDRADIAVEVFEKINRELSLWRLSLASWDVLMHYYLGQAYEQSRWNEKAIEQYEIFLTIWEKTDTELPEITDARRRLERLKQKS
ncbi:MAG: tetratricopeptide repeat protein [FCB group bacterium]|nr:tetratricopeptide repeat protein [FCB group bacterium]